MASSTTTTTTTTPSPKPTEDLAGLLADFEEKAKALVGSEGKLLGRGGFNKASESAHSSHMVVVKSTQPDLIAKGYYAKAEAIAKQKRVQAVAERSYQLLAERGISSPFLHASVARFKSGSETSTRISPKEGGDLLTYVETHRPLNYQTVMSLIAQMVEGVSALHAKGLVHRDISPENMLVSETPNGPHLKIYDLDTLEPVDPTTGRTTNQDMMVIGKKEYLSPEGMRLYTDRSCITRTNLLLVDAYALGKTIAMITADEYKCARLEPHERENVNNIISKLTDKRANSGYVLDVMPITGHHGILPKVIVLDISKGLLKTKGYAYRITGYDVPKILEGVILWSELPSSAPKTKEGILTKREELLPAILKYTSEKGQTKVEMRATVLSLKEFSELQAFFESNKKKFGTTEHRGYVLARTPAEGVIELTLPNDTIDSAYQNLKKHNDMTKHFGDKKNASYQRRLAESVWRSRSSLTAAISDTTPESAPYQSLFAPFRDPVEAELKEISQHVADRLIANKERKPGEAVKLQSERSFTFCEMLCVYYDLAQNGKLNFATMKEFIDRYYIGLLPEYKNQIKRLFLESPFVIGTEYSFLKDYAQDKMRIGLMFEAQDSLRKPEQAWDGTKPYRTYGPLKPPTTTTAVVASSLAATSSSSSDAEHKPIVVATATTTAVTTTTPTTPATNVANEAISPSVATASPTADPEAKTPAVKLR